MACSRFPVAQELIDLEAFVRLENTENSVTFVCPLVLLIVIEIPANGEDRLYGHENEFVASSRINQSPLRWLLIRVQPLQLSVDLEVKAWTPKRLGDEKTSTVQIRVLF